MRITPWTLAGLALLVAASACGGDTPDPLRTARRALERGELDRAEALLDGRAGAPAEDAREALAAARERRAQELARVEEALAGIPEEARIVVQRQLEEIRADARDPAVRTTIDVELSRLAETYADARREAAAAEARAAAERAPAPEPEVSADEPRRREREGTPSRGPAWDPYAAEDAAPEPRAAAPPAGDADVAVRVEPEPPRDDTSEPARGAALEAVDDASAARTGGAPSPAAGAPGASERLASATARARVDAARAHLRDGDLAAARDAYLDAAAAAEHRLERAEYAGLAEEVDERLALRRELAAAFAADPGPFRALGFEALDVRRVALDGEELGWREAPLAALVDAAERVALSTRAELGLVHERLARRRVDAAWRALDALVSAGRVTDADAAKVVARYRGEPVPEGGYVFADGAWTARAERERAERAAAVADLAERFVATRIGRGDELEDLAAELRALDAEAALSEAVAARYAEVAERVADDPGTRRIAAVAERRAALDDAREAALALIFDEEAYFYPYNPPECPPDKAARYPAVQRRVDELVGAVRDAWETDGGARPGDDLRELAGEVRQARRLAAELELELDPERLPAWWDGVPLDDERITVRTFAWDAEERHALARDRAVRAFNERQYEREWPDELGDANPNADERLQVRITNDYRAMMGRRALAWHPRIMAAAQDHADYMSRTGDFGHFEPDPETHSPNDRMRRRGYFLGRSENCSMSGGARAAHEGWLRSSGHHRNILTAGHREMASAVAGRYWVQNYGGGRSFENDL